MTKTATDRFTLVRSSLLWFLNLWRLVLVLVQAPRGQKTRPDQTFKHYFFSLSQQGARCHSSYLLCWGYSTCLLDSAWSNSYVITDSYAVFFSPSQESIVPDSWFCKYLSRARGCTSVLINDWTVVEITLWRFISSSHNFNFISRGCQDWNAGPEAGR